MQPDPIVVYSDDQRLLRDLPEQLRLDGYEPHTVQARRQFLWALAERAPAAVVLGDLPTLSQTLALLRELRAREAGAGGRVDPDVPVLVLSAAGSELCELRAFEAGADDFQKATTLYLVVRARLSAMIARSRITRHAAHVAVGVAPDRHGAARGDLRRNQARPIQTRVLPATSAGSRPAARLHQGRAAPTGLGLMPTSA